MENISFIMIENISKLYLIWRNYYILTLKFLRGCDVLVTFEIISDNKDAKIYEDKT